MKPSIFLSTPLVAVVLFGVVSCGGQNNNKSTDKMTTTDTTATTAATTTTAPATTAPATSTIITTPQTMMVVTHKVANYNKWQTSFDSHDSLRTANGVHSYVVGRSVKDSNTLLVATKVDDLNKAKAFAKNPALRQAMQKSGVVGAPMMQFTTMTYQDTANINTDLRVRSTFTVKDWDKWQRAFDSGRQVRLDNGLMDRAYGHDADDNHKVTVVLALTDTAKANALWKSDEMKRRQAASGMVGMPQRFVYRIVKKY